jgi:DNA-binding NtrC family response regulator
VRRWVLVADADAQAARSLSARLLRHGLWAYPAARGDDALRVVETRTLVLAVIDVSLEDMPGAELALRVRVLDPTLPVIMTTGDFRPELEVEARRVGIIHYAQKPLDDARLNAILAGILQGRGFAPSFRPVAGATR